jgi:valyl-tRNA synthetase
LKATIKTEIKNYDSFNTEREIIRFWEENNFFRADNSSEKPKYSISIPPPNVTGNLTIGHILNNTVQDVYSRWKRMSGYNVLWLPGADHAGIATQTVVEKRLVADGISKYDIGREKFIEKVWQWKEEYHNNIRNQLKRMGASVDWSRERFTMDEGLSRAVREVFVRLYRKGLIYRGKRIINWDPVQQTALSDEEVIYREKNDKLYYIRYPLINERDKFITSATTRPETMLGDVAVAVNPSDKRYMSFVGKQVMVPIAERAVPVIADEYVDSDFGTGALKITPAHDANDFEIGVKYNLDFIQVIDHTGKMNSLAGRFSGLERFEARERIIRYLADAGLLEKTEDYIHNVGFSERGNTPVEPFLSDQWFVKTSELAQPALNAVLSGEIRFYPERWVKTYEHWMRNIRDWCISRQLWWGHQIPVWYHKSSGDIYCDITPPHDPDNWEQDPDVLDTWFSSWLWPFSTLGWPEDTEDLRIYFPTDFLSTGPDIIFFWVARMIMASLEFTGKIPFREVYFHNIIRDDKGRKLSKSLGNSPDVNEVMDKYGADALRFTLIYLAPQGTDIYFSADKCTLGRNFANKIWNAARFLTMKLSQSSYSDRSYDTDIFDKWIYSRFNSTLRDISDSLERYRINDFSKTVYDFVWKDFCDWYLEILKIKSAVHPDLSYSIFSSAMMLYKNILRVLHPVMPFITEELWRNLKEENDCTSISVSEFPKADLNLICTGTENQINLFKELVTEIRRLKKETDFSNARIFCNSESDLTFFVNHRLYIEKLSKTSNLGFFMKDDASGQVNDKSQISIINGIEIVTEKPVSQDISVERDKLQAEIRNVLDFIEKLKTKVENEEFISKAPVHIVESEKKKLRDQMEKLEKLKMQMDMLS